MAARKLKPNSDAQCAIEFIRNNSLQPAQVAYRYTVKHIDIMCAEMGLLPIEKEKEGDKVIRLCKAIFPYGCPMPAQPDSSLAKDAQAAQEAAEVAEVARGLEAQATFGDVFPELSEGE